MPLVTGLEFAEKRPKQSLIIFTTAYSQYALKSYELDAIDYLLKPIEKHRLEKAIQKAELYNQLLSQSTIKNTIESNTNDFLFIKSDRRFYKLNFEEIKFIEGLKDYVVIHTKTQKLITAMNLKTIHLKIPGDKFLRVSKSYVVNINFIDSFDNHNIYIDESEIPLGEVFRSEFFRVYSGGSLNSEI
jgi:DNA-binding LytR/AlgR family response regulator